MSSDTAFTIMVVALTVRIIAGIVITLKQRKW